MKKIVFVLLALINLMFASNINLNDKEIIDKLALTGLQDSIKEVDKRNAGSWYLYYGKRQYWDRVRNDEFELEDHILKAYPEFIGEINNNQVLIGQKSELRLNIKFDKYDFEKKHFPLEMMTKDSYITYYGKNYAYSLTLTFNNTNPDTSYLPMEKADAKSFIQKRKGSGGYINRELTAVYYYTIDSVSTSNQAVFNCKTRDGYTNSCNSLNPKLIGKINKIEIQDDRGRVLHTINY